jgi:hypothetical protein
MVHGSQNAESSRGRQWDLAARRLHLGVGPRRLSGYALRRSADDAAPMILIGNARAVRACAANNELAGDLTADTTGIVAQLLAMSTVELVGVLSVRVVSRLSFNNDSMRPPLWWAGTTAGLTSEHSTQP